MLPFYMMKYTCDLHKLCGLYRKSLHRHHISSAGNLINKILHSHFLLSSKLVAILTDNPEEKQVDTSTEKLSLTQALAGFL